MSYYTIIEESSDNRINVLLTALAKAKHFIHNAPSEMRNLKYLQSKITQQIEDAQSILETLNGKSDGLSVMSQSALEQSIVHTKHNIDSLRMTEELFGKQAQEVELSAAEHEKAMVEIMESLHQQGATIQTLSTELSVTKYHGSNAFSEDGLLDVDAIHETINELADKHFKDIEVHVIPGLQAKDGPMVIDSYSKLCTFFYAPQDLEVVAGFMDELKEVFVKGKAENLYRDIMKKETPEDHYLVSSSFKQSGSDNFEEWLREYVELDSRHDLAYTIGSGDGDCLEDMNRNNKSFLEKTAERFNNAFETCPPQFKNSNEKWHEWRDNPFGGRSGIDKTREGYDDAYALSALSWYEEHPELAKQADKLLEGVIAKAKSATIENDTSASLGL
ncbi:hypothetical protein [Vibrio harveyi]|uniref:hypothetical protein n=1 Tax=Vibrio harveyi TaxID=669 RepID=UPI003CECF24B